MDYNKMLATVRGKNCEGEEFEEELVFVLIPPAEGSSYYGTGFYMRVDMSLSGSQFCDVRYSRTSDVEILADRFIENWYGPNAQEVSKMFIENVCDNA